SAAVALAIPRLDHGLMAKDVVQHYVPLASATSWVTLRHLVPKLVRSRSNSALKEIDMTPNGTMYYTDQASIVNLPDATRRAQARGIATAALDGELVTSRLLDDFNVLVELCKTHGIKIVGLKYPLSKELQVANSAYAVDQVQRVYRGRAVDFAGIV